MPTVIAIKMHQNSLSADELSELASNIRAWGAELGFQQIGIADIDLAETELRLEEWLARGFHGEMTYMSRHGTRRTRPSELIQGTCRVICARMNHLPAGAHPPESALADKNKAYVARYALGRDYHKLLRRRLQQLSERVTAAAGEWGYRVFVDSGPVMEKPLAAKAGLGWQGKHSNLLNREAGSWFMLGTIYTDLPLPVDAPVTNHCGSCTACIDVCPTGAIVAPYVVDARRCISYLTIELRGSIPEDLRPDLGNRVFGCDDCQLHCPWNKYAHTSDETDFSPRHGLDSATLLSLFAWDEATWEKRTRGSALRRPGYDGWLRNLAVALGNAPPSQEICAALTGRRASVPPMVQEHIDWALRRQLEKSPA